MIRALACVTIIAVTVLLGIAGRADEHPGLHNLVSYRGSGPDAFYSGSAPDGDAGFSSLAALGIRTILSVDGATPDIARAKAGHMRYVHLPIGYDGFDDARKAELVRAVRDLPKPIYIHCHHGKHRSASAAAAIAVSLGWLTNSEAAAQMKDSGTAEAYKGLWSCAAKAAPMTAAAIDAARADFPEVTKPGSLVAAMVAADEALDRLKLVEKHGWIVPASHPDLVPAADAGKIAELLRLLHADEHLGKSCEEEERAGFRALLAANAAQAAALEQLLATSPGDASVPIDGAARSASLGALGALCRDCHAKHRD